MQLLPPLGTQILDSNLPPLPHTPSRLANTSLTVFSLVKWADLSNSRFRSKLLMAPLFLTAAPPSLTLLSSTRAMALLLLLSLPLARSKSVSCLDEGKRGEETGESMS